MSTNIHYYCGVGIILSNPVTETKSIEIKTREDSAGNSYPEDILYSPKTGELLKTTIEYKKHTSEVKFNYWDYIASFGGEDMFFMPEYWGDDIKRFKVKQMLLIPNYDEHVELFSLECGIYPAIDIEDMVYKFQKEFSKILDGLKKYFNSVEVKFIYTDYSN